MAWLRRGSGGGSLKFWLGAKSPNLEGNVGQRGADRRRRRGNKDDNLKVQIPSSPTPDI